MTEQRNESFEGNTPVNSGLRPGDVKERPMNREEQLTAYALGELTGDEARDVEQLIERDAEAKAHVDEMKALAGELAGALADEDAPTLTEAQRRALDGEGRESDC